ncbi:potassium channel family protein [Planctomycetes bacterium K23_9]|uniref:Voltage-gated potassium channel Kch n=1 Tax=Stieleria marina TaxID=1930275 RepID=A0A517NVM7_9BACT|nr:Voltage-gated potassium channel Kch [Planctomycetes bacterium K23_9]
MVAILIIGGTCGYVLIEGWPFADSIYMTLITLSTVGFGEVQELTPQGRIFTSMLITVSIVLMACWTAGITTILVSGELSGRFLMQKEKKMISQMKDHVIVCGGGVTAMTVIGRLIAEGTPVVAIADSKDEIESIRRIAPEMPVIDDDPKSEMALVDSNALAAKYLVAATESDYDNLLITISGKGLGTDLQVISFAHSNELASRMFKVGADDVVCPLIIGGEHVAQLIRSES